MRSNQDCGATAADRSLRLSGAWFDIPPGGRNHARLAEQDNHFAYEGVNTA
jgi:hypothetical protein